MKRDLEVKAKKLRKEGYSIKELKEILKVSKSTLSRWLQDVELSFEARRRLEENYTKGQLNSQEVIKRKTEQKNFEAESFAIDLLKNSDISNNISLLLCAMIYQCEGNKSIKDSVTFTNSDPALIKTFVYLFRKSFNLDERKFRVLMHLHDYHDECIQKKFWSKITGVPISQFLKTYNKVNTGVYKKENYQGCIQIRYRDVTIGRKLQAVAKTFMEGYK